MSMIAGRSLCTNGSLLPGMPNWKNLRQKSSDVSLQTWRVQLDSLDPFDLQELEVLLRVFFQNQGPGQAIRHEQRLCSHSSTATYKTLFSPKLLKNGKFLRLGNELRYRKLDTMAKFSGGSKSSSGAISFGGE